MTNAEIIMKESIRLMNAGELKGSGTRAKVEIEGKLEEIELPEEIHTFNGWKERGYSVKKGEHSRIKISIWKHTAREKKPEEKNGSKADDVPVENMFLKLSAFFTFAQVEPIKA